MIKCKYCGKEYSNKGIGTHIWRKHGLGLTHDPNIGYKKDRIVWNKGLNAKTNKSVKAAANKIKGQPNKCKGKTFEDIYGEEKAILMKKNIIKRQTEKYKNIEERIYLRDIGRKGGFGKKGYTENGTYYQSKLEKQCFEYLEENNIKFEAHKNIPNSSKISDIYFADKNLWIELDGINREQKKKWLGKNYDYWIEKLKIYKEQKLNLKICYNFNEFASVV